MTLPSTGRYEAALAERDKRWEAEELVHDRRFRADDFDAEDKDIEAADLGVILLGPPPGSPGRPGWDKP